MRHPNVRRLGDGMANRLHRPPIVRLTWSRRCL
jgi:hypothetical protein